LISHELKLCRQQKEEEELATEEEEIREEELAGDVEDDLSSLSSADEENNNVDDVKKSLQNETDNHTNTLSSSASSVIVTGGGGPATGTPVNQQKIQTITTTTTTKNNSLPENRERESCLLFIDITGFTKLSTILDVESLSRVINNYFDQIIKEVNLHGGDVLKFAGDALFVEWRVGHDDGDGDDDSDNDDAGNYNDSTSIGTSSNVLKELNSSLSSLHDDDDNLSGSLGLPVSVLRAAKCAAAIVRKYSDHEVTLPNHRFGSDTATGSIGVLNVHCGIGAGKLMGVHVGDYQEEEGGDEEPTVELRREYLFLGDAINQVSLKMEGCAFRRLAGSDFCD
jgi:class 3 adenylate cyclase